MMIQRLTCIALLFAVFVTAHGRANSVPARQSPGGPGGPFSGGSGPNKPFPGGAGSEGAFPGGFGSNGQFPGGFGSNGPFPGGEEFMEKIVSKICANPTTAQELLAKIQQVISTLQSNGSFAQVLADRANEVAYIQNAANAALLSSDCNAFFSGLKSAKEADAAALKARFQYYPIAAAAMMQAVRSVIEGVAGN